MAGLSVGLNLAEQSTGGASELPSRRTAGAEFLAGMDDGLEKVGTALREVAGAVIDRINKTVPDIFDDKLGLRMLSAAK